MGGLSLGKTPEEMMRDKAAIDAAGAAGRGLPPIPPKTPAELAALDAMAGRRPGGRQPASEQGIYTAEMGQPPMEPDMGSLPPPPPKRPPPRPPARPAPRTTKPKKAEDKTYAKGGSIDGCAQRGKTRGKVV